MCCGIQVSVIFFGTNVRVQGSIWTVLAHSGAIFPLKTKSIMAEENCSNGGDGIFSITAVAEKKAVTSLKINSILF